MAAPSVNSTQFRDEFDRWLGISKVSLQSRYHAELQEVRTNEACAFLLAHPNFKLWYDASDPAWLVIFGDMGHGKTVAMSFIIDELRRRNERQLPQPKICYHYCRNYETGQTSYIFSSLILSLLQQFAGLKKTFHQWYKEKQASGIQDPVQNARELGGFFETAVKSLDRPLFVVIDGLDECSRVSRKALLKSLRVLTQTTSRLKIIVSSRPGRQITESLHNLPRLDLGSDEQRDVVIVRHIVDSQLSYLSQDVKAVVIESLSRLAKGSAIWTKMTVNLIEIRQIEALAPMQRFFEEASLPDQLYSLYVSMVMRYCGDDPENKKITTTALKLLAVARRPLSIQELAWGVGMAVARDEVSSIAELALLVDHERVMNLIQPFILRPDLDDPRKRQIRLIHHSVEEFVVQQWPLLQNPSATVTPTQVKGHQRAEVLESFILEICIDYLLLDEVGSIPLFSQRQLVIAKLPKKFDIFEDIQPSEHDPSWTWEVLEKHMIRYDPVERGFGHFFVYAASQWLRHLGAVQSGNLPSLSKIERLCQARSVRLDNWINQNCRPDCVIKARFDFYSYLYDPLGIVSLYGSDAMLYSMLENSNFEKDKFLPTSALTAVDEIMRWGNLSRLVVLFSEPKFAHQLQSLGFFVVVMRRWCEIGVRHDNWSMAFDLVLSVLDKLTQERWGAKLLCAAARIGCIKIVQHLLNDVQHSPELKTELLRGPQSIAEAVLGNNPDVIECLLAQEGFEAHLEYTTRRSEHLLHRASNWCNPAVFRLLVPRLQHRIYQTDYEGYTALAQVIDQRARSQNRYESAKILLLSQVARDGVGYPEDAKENPLRLAVQLGDTEMCRLLLDDGNMDPRSVLVRGDDGLLVLKDKPPINDEAIAKLLQENASTITTTRYP